MSDWIIWVCQRCGHTVSNLVDEQCARCGWIRPGKITDDSNLETVRKLREWYDQSFYSDAENHDYVNWDYQGSPRDLWADMKEIVEATTAGDCK